MKQSRYGYFEGVNNFFSNTQGRIELLKSGTQLLYRYKDAQAAT